MLLRLTYRDKYGIFIEMGRLLKTWQRGLGFAMAALTLATLFALIPTGKASAAPLSADQDFVDASKWQLKALVFTNEAITEEYLDPDLVDAIGGGNRNLGLTRINDGVKALTNNGSALWFDSDAADDTKEYILTGCRESKFSYDKSDKQWQIEKLSINFLNVGCHDVLFEKDIHMPDISGSDEDFQTLFEWVNSKTIVRVDGVGGNYKELDATAFPNVFFRKNQQNASDRESFTVDRICARNAGSCRTTADGDKILPGTYHFTTGIDFGPAGNTLEVHNVEYNVRNFDNSDDVDDLPATDDEELAVDNKCETANPEGALAWIGCSLLRVVDKTLEGITNQVQGIMEIDTVQLYKCSASGEQTGCLEGAWRSMRNISSILLVLFALIMVLSTAIGVGPFDAYTIRKVLPRMVVAVILAQLSWSLMVLMIEIVNDVGNGISALMLQPFGGEQVTNLATVLSSTGSGIGWFNGAAGGALGAGAVALGIAGFVSLAFTTLLGILIGFLVLILRNIVIITALIFSPIAIISYILPGTEKIGKIWWDSFSKGLLMFPIIMALFTTGRIFAWVTGSTEAATAGGPLDGQVYQFVIVIIAYVAPYFMIPATFKLAGGAIATLGGMANDRSRGIFDRAKKKRGERIAHNVANAKTGNRWDKNSKLFGVKVGAIGSKLAGIGVEPLKNAGYYGGKAHIPGLKKYSAHVGASIRNSAVDSTTKLFQKLNETGLFNDKAYAAIAGEFGRYLEASQDMDKTEEERRSAGKVAKALISKGFMDSSGKTKHTAHTVQEFRDLADALAEGDGETEQIAANALRHEAGYLATVHEDPDFGYASIEGAGALGWAAHGFADGKGLANIANRLKKTGGSELAHAITTKAQVFGQAQRPDIKAGYGVLFDKETGQFIDGMDIEKDERGQYKNERAVKRAREWLGTVKQQDWLGAKAGAVKRAKPLIMEEAMQRERAMVRNAQTGQMEEQEVFTAKAKALQEAIALGASAFSSSDADAKVEWQEMSKKLGLERMVAEQDAAMRAMRASGREGGPPGEVPLPPGMAST